MLGMLKRRSNKADDYLVEALAEDSRHLDRLDQIISLLLQNKYEEIMAATDTARGRTQVVAGAVSELSFLDRRDWSGDGRGRTGDRSGPQGSAR